MKITKLIAPLFVLASLVLFMTSCGGGGDPAAYNNKLMGLITNNEKNMTAMNLAMSSADYKKAEETRKTWEADLSKSIEEASKTDDFKGNNDFKNAVINGLNNYKKVVTKDYKSLIELRTNKQNGDASQVAHGTELLNNINKTLEDTANEINKASSDFETKSIQNKHFF